jgi:hypothetical protein
MLEYVILILCIFWVVTSIVEKNKLAFFGWAFATVAQLVIMGVFCG